MKRIFYYTTTALVLSCGISQAQTCVPTPTCSTLGYTSTTACDGGLKCPFGEAWNCSINDIKTEIMEIKNIIGQQQQENCVIGAILYSDMTCSSTVVAGKTPIGIVVYIGASGYQALALETIGNYAWSTEAVDILGLTNYNSPAEASKDYNSCGNTEKIIAQGDRNIYPAAWAAHEYSTEGTSAGDWCLPAAGIFTSYYNNQDAINTGFIRAGGTKFSASRPDTYAWSSSELNATNYYFAWYSYFRNDNYGLNSYINYTLGYNKSDSLEVRPVLEF